MKKTVLKVIAILLCAVILAMPLLTAFAGNDAFAENAYANIVTVSDCQDWGSLAFVRFAKILNYMKNDGLPEPDSVLAGGDFSRAMYNYATLGIIELREAYCSVYTGANPDDVICCQGNHDLHVANFPPSGMYDMSTYNLWLINEDDFPWEQYDGSSKEAQVKALAAKMEETFDLLIRAGDMRPVIVLTHVPLHHSPRSSYGDNMYSSYLFNVINKAAETLDIIFLFGHNHSGKSDDYIGGSINYMAPGDTIRIPITTQRGAECYTVETLNFTYTNCGYIGYCNNSENDTSTKALALGLIRFLPDRFIFLKYTEKGGFLRKDVVERKNTAKENEMVVRTEAKRMDHHNSAFWNTELAVLGPIIRFFLSMFTAFVL